MVSYCIWLGFVFNNGLLVEISELVIWFSQLICAHLLFVFTLYTTIHGCVIILGSVCHNWFPSCWIHLETVRFLGWWMYPVFGSSILCWWKREIRHVVGVSWWYLLWGLYGLYVGITHILFLMYLVLLLGGSIFLLIWDKKREMEKKMIGVSWWLVVWHVCVVHWHYSRSACNTLFITLSWSLVLMVYLRIQVVMVCLVWRDEEY